MIKTKNTCCTLFAREGISNTIIIIASALYLSTCWSQGVMILHTTLRRFCILCKSSRWTIRNKGLFHDFLWVRGGWWDLRGAMQKNMASKGGPARKIWCVKGGGVTKKISFKFSSDSICNNANISARRPKIAILRFWKFKFSRGRMPPDPLLYYTPNGNSTPPTVSLQNTARGMSTLFWPLLVWFLNNW